MLIDLVAAPGEPPVRAEVAAGGWFDGDGDLALLELATPVTELRYATLHQRSVSLMRGQRVRTRGFPADPPDGTWATAIVGRPGGPRGEWVALNRIPSAHDVPVAAGFSGAGVVDERTGAVVGLMVAEYNERDLAWMVPVETVVGYLPALARQVTGGPSADQVFRDRAPRVFAALHARPDNLAADVVQLVGRLAPGTPGGFWNVVGEDADRLPVIALVVGLADPWLRPALPIDLLIAPHALTLPLGSIDVAVDATGRTTEEVAKRISERVGPLIGHAAGAPPEGFPASVTVVVDSVDRAATPASLVTDVLKPLADRATRNGIRLLAGSSTPLTGSGATTVLMTGHGRSYSLPTDALSTSDRLDELDKLVDEVDAAEESARGRFAEIGPRIAGAPKPPNRAPKLRLRATELRLAAELAAPDDARVPAAVGRAARRTTEALDGAMDVLRQYDDLRHRCRSLGGLLDAFRDRAVSIGLTEDLDLAALYKHASGLLAGAPSDLDAADVAVRRYLDEIWRRLGMLGEAKP